MCRERIYWVLFVFVCGTAAQVFAQLPPGWSSRDIGGPAAAGSARYDDDARTWTIQADGTGIRERADQFHYVYKPLSGDGELVARVVSLEPAVDEWAIAGVMIRVFLDPGSPYVIMGVTPNGPSLDHGVTYYGRALPGEVADHESSGAMTVPYWVKISRTGDTFAGYHSPDGRTWTEQYSDTAAGVPKNIYIGYAVTSDVGGTLVTAVLDSGPTKAYSPDPADGAKHVAAPFLQWAAGATAASHDVYFGTNPTPGPAEYMGRKPLDQPMYWYPSGFAPGTAYFWRVDEIAADGTTIHTGDVWSFTSAPATAYAPRPWDGGKGVEAEAELGWAAGAGAISHDVYFGTDQAAVEAGDPSTFKGNQVLRTYRPDTLTENTAYYWKIDEHTAADVVHQGEVWSFRTLGPADGVKAQYFEGTDVSGVPVLTRIEEAIDHNWGGEIAGGLSDKVSARWTADLEAPLTETVTLITTTDDGARLWLNGRLLIEDWTNHGPTDNRAEVRLVAGQVYALVMEWYDDTGGAVAQLSWESPSIARQIIPPGPLQLPVRATGPYPAHEAVHTPHALQLRWSAGGAAAQHDVYFGDDPEAVAAASAASAGTYRGRQALDETAYDPGLLEWNTTYYWRIDEVNAANPDGPWKGSVWSFTTADFIVVDDFESYTDDIDAEEAIYQTWIDGWTNNTGSVVGYLVAPFAERTIVKSGAQSMPLAYDNRVSPYYSETERTWSTPQDWTIAGIDTLTLSVRGSSGNDAAALYVAIADRAGQVGVVVHPDSNVLLTTKWTEWKVPLSDFTNAGVDMAAVKTLYIGAGDRRAPTPGGTGLLYLDDIWATGPEPVE